MKNVTFYYILGSVLVLFPSLIAYGQKALNTDQQAAIDDFLSRTKAYAKLHDDIERKLIKVPAEASKEQVQAYKESFQRYIRSARKNAKQGDVLTPAAAETIRYMIATAYAGQDRIKLRTAVSEAENKDVPVTVNAFYPESAEILETPPKLLLVLPQLPQQLRYRFVGRQLLLMDPANHLIVDHMPNAIP